MAMGRGEGGGRREEGFVHSSVCSVSLSMLNGVMFSQEFSYVYNPYPLILHLKDFFNKLVLAGNGDIQIKRKKSLLMVNRNSLAPFKLCC